MKKILVILMLCLFGIIGCTTGYNKVIKNAKDYCIQTCKGKLYNVVCFEYDKPDQPICMCGSK